MKKKGYSLLSVIIIIVVTSVVSGITVGTILTKNANIINGSYINDKDLQEFLEVYSKLKTEYYEDVDTKKLIEGAIDGMLSTVDESYTTLMNEDETSMLDETLNGTYEGVGITISDHEVFNIVPGSPAEKSGVLSGDIIKSVNGTDVKDMNATEISELIKSQKDNVTIVFQRSETEYTVNLKITTLNVPVVTYQMINNTNIGYMKVSVFSSNVSNEIKTSLETLKNSGMKGLILDLRGNSGGYLEQGYASAALFTKKGTTIYSLKNKNGKEEFKDNDDNEENIPVVVLINQGTASSAEILTAALKDNYGATTVGTTSYGKGKVQHTYKLTDGTMAKYTSYLWLRPNGECIDGKGIKPDYEVDNEFVYDEASTESTLVIGVIDHQYETAKKLLSN